jgi:hypothetical protein
MPPPNTFVPIWNITPGHEIVYSLPCFCPVLSGLKYPEFRAGAGRFILLESKT